MAEYLHVDAKRARARRARGARPPSRASGTTRPPRRPTMAQASGLRDEIESYEADRRGARRRRGRQRARRRRGRRGARRGGRSLARRPREAHRRRSRSARGSPASSTTATRSSPSHRARAGSRPRTGPRCCCGCTRSTPSARSGRSTCTTRRAGVELGIDRAVFTVHGRNAYGMLSSEVGVHRLVRISPTDEKKRRQTTFAGVEVLPVLPDDIDGRHPRRGPAHRRVPLQRPRRPEREHDRLGGAHHAHPDGHRRHRARTRSRQHKNKDAAMKILRSRLYEIEKAKRDAEIDELRGREARHQLRQPDPQLRALPLPAGEGRAHRHRDRQRRRRARRRHRRVRGRLPPLARAQEQGEPATERRRRRACTGRDRRRRRDAPARRPAHPHDRVGSRVLDA